MRLGNSLLLVFLEYPFLFSLFLSLALVTSKEKNKIAIEVAEAVVPKNKVSKSYEG